ncbi:exodeoxyribonuclease III [Lactobacillus jensenii]|jgi:exodeoxyribonuclease III|uniref:Exodeoxyribonuclease n=1 Tax=Lactobacillus jensenii TaxID=109790 RepID=A0A5N1IC09_LACJE|nr:exodeoxyribonuclease III [Lactobacillus jensenii]ERJ43241.1 exodeoxyribonuclease [Lactobacillus jensenii MD IIE-70(2)]APT14004.1 exodeoxyribonuclease III [Lactobacillus jensenii]EEQ23920.1 exodeoxyribonuclease III [Lactobacillus jensenii 269-3]EEX26951.1 exodeoxyribonuclease III [Lactobacillus jensenii SJ-7A-US]KAA9234555.1 exodeoxyribonuclease III [Lactobacillus jensenii]
MLLISWNIDSLNAALTSDSARAQKTRHVLTQIAEKEPDILAIQETKLRATGPTKKHAEILQEMFPDYDYVWRSSEEPARKGYAGTMYLYKKSLKPEVSYPKIGAPDTMDFEGRIITLEFPEYFVTQVYTPNAGGELKRLSDRQGWDKKYIEYLQELDVQKPVLASGDYNVAHEEIDLKHPENNHHSAGFTDEERADFTELLAAGFTDSFRKIHGNIPEVYSWWAQRIRTAKANNSGWRIDYWLTSNRIADKIKKSEMMDTGERADHCPIVLEIEL